jgi:tRNA pseudouridine32 synthase / 23S rRNA pseudouridine746 synthase
MQNGQPPPSCEMEILYYDEEIVVINKPGGLLAVPGRGPEKQDCAAHRLRRLFPGMICQPAVHRLDMATSGLMVFAVTTGAQKNLNQQFAQRLVDKGYLAVVHGIVATPGGTINLPHRLDPVNRPRQIYDPVHGKSSLSLWRRIAIEGDCSRIAWKPITGRTHQLRVHAAHPLGLGAAIVGDSIYGTGREGGKMLLHATTLGFCHPKTGEPLRFISPPPF